ncbi:MAG TPA: two-component system response regulator [Cyanobacteria bacterium UBA11370]|nr:two-component system response regulator [Cyanobacteria bacterium UBA11370]HBY80738.1 two-component system response regulator [Cyanobacteria bacterium UBA11148]
MLSCEKPIVRVLVVDDHELTRFCLKLALSTQKNIELVGMASNGQEAIEMVERYYPDVVILDLQMPVMDGLTAAIQIKRLNPDIQIIAYSSYNEFQTEIDKQSAKIDAFCRKEAATTELVSLVNQLGKRQTGADCRN